MTSRLCDLRVFVFCTESREHAKVRLSLPAACNKPTHGEGGKNKMKVEIFLNPVCVEWPNADAL